MGNLDQDRVVVKARGHVFIKIQNAEDARAGQTVYADGPDGPFSLLPGKHSYSIGVVRFKETTSGTFIGPLDLTTVGLGVIQPNGKSFTLPGVTIKITVVNGLITRQQDLPPPPGQTGYQLLLDKLGIEIPESNQ